MVKFLCATKHKAICCDLSKKWIHIDCNNLNKTTYIYIQHSDTNWFCIPCLKKEIYFNTLTDQELEKVYIDKHMLYFISKHTQKFTKNANDFLQDETNSKINGLSYYIVDFNKMVATHENSFLLLHLNIS